MKTYSRTAAAALGLLLLTPTAAVALPTATPPAATSTCQIVWGSLGKSRSDPGGAQGTLTNLRAGRHGCFDRAVIDLAGVPAAQVGYVVSYVDEVVRPGSGEPVPLAGGARLQATVTVPSYDDQGRLTYQPSNPDAVVDVGGYSTLRQVALAGSFEGQTTFGVGVRARLPFRVFVLDGPGNGSRVVIDVAHRW